MIDYIKFSWISFLAMNHKYEKAIGFFERMTFGDFYRPLAEAKIAECYFRKGNAVKAKEIFLKSKKSILNSNLHDNDIKTYTINYIDAHISILDGNRNIENFLIDSEKYKINSLLRFSFFVSR